MPRYGDLNKLKSEFEWLLTQVSESSKDEIRDVIKRIDNAPTADVAPVVHARWVYERTYQGMKYVCSECGEIPECFEPNYCPNCGAKMDGERRNDEQKTDS